MENSNDNDENSQESPPMSLDYSPLSLRNITQTQLGESQTSTIIKDRPPKNYKKLGDLRSVEEIPSLYRHIFCNHPYFNFIQSKVLDQVLYSDVNVVLSSPTGSGKTVIFELAIIQLLMHLEDTNYVGDYKIVYVAPIKALCTERLCDWHKKFSEIGLPCIEVTSDTERLEIRNLEKYKIIITTPEKWDSLTRKWKDNKAVVKMVKLFMIDEIHLLNDKKRGPTLEAIISRMKTIQEVITLELRQKSPNFRNNNFNIRFIGVSATLNNIQDIAMWLGRNGIPALSYSFGEEYRPVNLKKVVLGYPVTQNSTPYKFDMSLNYKLASVIMQYSDNKPTLVFCTTRKGMPQTANILKMALTFRFSSDQKDHIKNLAEDVIDPALRELLLIGIGWHNAGMQPIDREITETLFRAGLLPVLLTTSTLAMGVNLPAHLVIIKSTEMYKASGYEEYDEISLLQMIGRAGRPQFDTSAIAVIMTKLDSKRRYENLITGQKMIESNLHRHLGEYLNAEVVLHTVTDLVVAMDWIRTTFLYVRSLKNPKYYGFQEHWSKEIIESKLQEMCEVEIRRLEKFGLVKIDEVQGIDVSPTIYGQLMARYYLAFETMQLFSKIQPTEFLSRILSIVCQAAEFSEISLRVNDKKTLNALNNKKNDECIRFPLPGKIKSLDMKINCLIQAVCGSLKIIDSTLRLESVKIMRIAERITSCLCDYLNADKQYFEALKNTIILTKCLRAHLWENSPFVSRQLDKIGPVFSQLLANAGKTTFQAILETNARDLERILNRGATFGNHIVDLVTHLPVYTIAMDLSYDLVQDETRLAEIIVKIRNLNDIKNKTTTGKNHKINILVGDTENNTLLYEKILDGDIINSGEVKKHFSIMLKHEHDINIYVISDDWVGLDFQQTVKIPPLNPPRMPNAATSTKITAKVAPNNGKIMSSMSSLALSSKNAINLSMSSPKNEILKKWSGTVKTLSSQKKKTPKSNCTSTNRILPTILLKQITEKNMSLNMERSKKDSETTNQHSEAENPNDFSLDLSQISQIQSSLDSKPSSVGQQQINTVKRKFQVDKTPPRAKKPSTISLKEEVLCKKQLKSPLNLVRTYSDTNKMSKQPKTVTFLVDNKIVTPQKSVNTNFYGLEEIESDTVLQVSQDGVTKPEAPVSTPIQKAPLSVVRNFSNPIMSNNKNKFLEVLHRISSVSEKVSKNISKNIAYEEPQSRYVHKKFCYKQFLNLEHCSTTSSQLTNSTSCNSIDLKSFCATPKPAMKSKITNKPSLKSVTSSSSNSSIPKIISNQKVEYPLEYVENIIENCWNRNKTKKSLDKSSSKDLFKSFKALEQATHIKPMKMTQCQSNQYPLVSKLNAQTETPEQTKSSIPKEIQEKKILPTNPHKSSQASQSSHPKVQRFPFTRPPTLQNIKPNFAEKNSACINLKDYDDFPTLSEINQIYNNIHETQLETSKIELQAILNTKSDKVMKDENLHKRISDMTNTEILQQAHPKMVAEELKPKDMDGSNQEKKFDLGEKELVESFFRYSPSPPEKDTSSGLNQYSTECCSQTQNATTFKNLLSQFTDAASTFSKPNFYLSDNISNKNLYHYGNNSHTDNDYYQQICSDPAKLNHPSEKNTQVFENQVPEFSDSQPPQVENCTSFDNESIFEYIINSQKENVSQNQYNENYQFLQFEDSDINNRMDWNSHEKQSDPYNFFKAEISQKRLNGDLRNSSEKNFYQRFSNSVRGKNILKSNHSFSGNNMPAYSHSGDGCLNDFNFYQKPEFFFEYPSTDTQPNTDLFEGGFASNKNRNFQF